MLPIVTNKMDEFPVTNEMVEFPVGIQSYCDERGFFLPSKIILLLRQGHHGEDRLLSA